jgi:hypothetical protein
VIRPPIVTDSHRLAVVQRRSSRRPLQLSGKFGGDSGEVIVSQHAPLTQDPFHAAPPTTFRVVCPELRLAGSSRGDANVGCMLDMMEGAERGFYRSLGRPDQSSLPSMMITVDSIPVSAGLPGVQIRGGPDVPCSGAGCWHHAPEQVKNRWRVGKSAGGAPGRARAVSGRTCAARWEERRSARREGSRAALAAATLAHLDEGGGREGSRSEMLGMSSAVRTDEVF